MENLNYNAKMLQRLVGLSAFDDEPFVFLDVGCSGGIVDIFRNFGTGLVAHGIDPQQSEVERLNQCEEHPNVRYHAYFAGLPDDHRFIQLKKQHEAESSDYTNPWNRLSCAYASTLESVKAARQSNPIFENLTSEKISVSEFVRRQGLDYVDFIKTDTDGSDFEAVLSCEDIIQSHQPLGFQIEAPFTGTSLETANSFHNIDRLMRRWGYLLYGMEICHYSRRHLPAQFKYDILAQTVSGQPIWADVLYMRDAAHPDFRRIAGHTPTTAKLLKLAATFELFNLADCAAELIIEHKEAFRQQVDPTVLLNDLTPTLNGTGVSYQEYVDTFETEPAAFFPKRENAA